MYYRIEKCCIAKCDIQIELCWNIRFEAVLFPQFAQMWKYKKHQIKKILPNKSIGGTPLCGSICDIILYAGDICLYSFCKNVDKII